MPLTIYYFSKFIALVLVNNATIFGILQRCHGQIFYECIQMLKLQYLTDLWYFDLFA